MTFPPNLYFSPFVIFKTGLILSSYEYYHCSYIKWIFLNGLCMDTEQASKTL